MTFIPVENCAHVLIQGSLFGQQVDNDLYFRHTTGPIAASDLVTLATDIGSWWTTTIVPLLNEQYTAIFARARDLTTQFGFSSEVSLGATAGGVTGESAPNNCTMAVSFRTAFVGRSNRGRNYVPVLTNSQVTDNTIDAGFATDIVNGYALLIAGGGATPAGWTWVVVSRFNAGLPRVAGVFNEIFTVLTTDLIVDSQRRRLPGRGA